MESYIVEYKTKEKKFMKIHDAIKFAEKTAEIKGINTYVYGEKNGIKDEEPFLRVEWEF